MADLELVETDDLIAELSRRFEVSCFVGMREVRGGRGEYVQHHANGESVKLIGMIEREKVRLLAEMIEAGHEGSDDD